MIARKFGRAGRGIALLLLAGVIARPAPPEKKLSGSIAVYVTNTAGMPQMGATVLLFDGVDRIIRRALTDEAGSFLFDSLPAGAYSIRVSLASFLPALKRNIAVQPGMRSLLSVNLAGVLSSIELVYSAKGSRAVMSDDWKWVLRSSEATRPVLRFGPSVTVSHPDDGGSPFSETRAMVKVSAGDQGAVSQFGNEPDLGTAFALATSVFGDNQVHVSGNFGYSAATGLPTAGFRTSYSRGGEGSGSAQVNLTLRQWYLPARVGAGLLSGQRGAAPALRTMSVGFFDRKELAQGLHLDYGFSLESVSFLSTLNYFSPYGRLTYDLGPQGVLEFAFNSGLPPTQFLAQRGEASSDLQQDLAALSLFPRVSLRRGQVRVQRADNLEIAYRKTIGSRTYGLAGYLGSVKNAALTMVASAGAVPPGDLLPDLLSNSAVFNVGDYSSAGYMASVTQALGSRMNLSLTGGSGGALIPVQGVLHGGSGDELRKTIQHGQRRWLAVVFSAAAPRTGSQLTASYRWADGRALTAPHAYLTRTAIFSDIGLNLHFRQPVPWGGGMRGRLEITGDARNVLGQGYLPLSVGQGRRALLVHTPRNLRGGFNFIF
ncbi:MAG: carboxypeptidase regulatory-like domain-containing protein [Bryobacterales bacterium]|nr:carboxypeptidase regulatory-like domain-containing protein [Bryobacterales bacterium]